MNSNQKRFSTSLWPAEFLSPKYLLRWAILISILYALASATGLREFTPILNGTMGSVSAGWQISALLGLCYIFLYLGFVLLVPILLLAAGLLLLWQEVFQRTAIGARSNDEPRTNTSAKDPLRHLALHNRSRH
jgi:hypothetical protein